MRGEDFTIRQLRDLMERVRAGHVAGSIDVVRIADIAALESAVARLENMEDDRK